MKDLTHYKKLGETRDDAIGEAFDKVARLLNLPYPGGPEIEKLALRRAQDRQNIIQFPRPMINQKNYDFSFSGLKTAVLYYLRDLKEIQNKQQNSEIEAKQGEILRETTRKIIRENSRQYSQEFASNVCASFQVAAFDVLIYKTLRAAREFKAKSILISGGVASNNELRRKFNSKLKAQNSKLIFLPSAKKFCTDNAAMIAVAGYLNYLKKKKYLPVRQAGRLVAQGNLSLS